MKKSFLLVMVIAFLMPQETFGAQAKNNNLSFIKNHLKNNAQEIVNNAFLKGGYQHVPQTNTAEYDNVYKMLVEDLVSKTPRCQFSPTDTFNTKILIGNVIHFFLGIKSSFSNEITQNFTPLSESLKDFFEKKKELEKRNQLQKKVAITASLLFLGGGLAYKYLKLYR